MRHYNNRRPRDRGSYNPKWIVDLNCDLAQKWGPFSHKDEEQLLPFVSSVNIAAGGHAGDSVSVLEALRKAKEKSLSVGAHIGYNDIAGFGRKEIRLDHEELKACVLQQLGFIFGLAKSVGIEITHVRPHGAMYYKCGVDTVFAEQLAKAVSEFSGWLTFVGPAGNYLNSVSDASGLKTVGEVHLDRPYRRDGTLYRFPSNKYVSFEFAMAQVNSLIYQSKLIVEGGRRVRLPFKTIHLNLDRPYSIQLAENLNNMLRRGPTPFEGVSKVPNMQPSDLSSITALSNLYEQCGY
ncbi:MAG: LamB/YcsF family protein [Candidatus Caenarcaniphilales bacterium]|nr:LamB/YcsF family protein [Candidatus Caenarcaniphilales bacterium]